eukprot:TRINITY_DN5306_c0_g1_i1.p1 TRINITY_DN5306_c0_g1~~TRINITY_DN5306_c0_g1_i1.p1  ORF type:complete len:304 (-),score=78.52 TRINITY_DN5306_c0_g1_i1:60-857(-)
MQSSLGKVREATARLSIDKLRGTNYTAPYKLASLHHVANYFCNSEKSPDKIGDFAEKLRDALLLNDVGPTALWRAVRSVIVSVLPAQGVRIPTGPDKKFPHFERLLGQLKSCNRAAWLLVGKANTFFDLQPNQTRGTVLLLCNGPGLMMLIAAASSTYREPVLQDTIELDCRGSFELVPVPQGSSAQAPRKQATYTIVLHVGEIKTTSGGFGQLQLSLATLSWACPYLFAGLADARCIGERWLLGGTTDVEPVIRNNVKLVTYRI